MDIERTHHVLDGTVGSGGHFKAIGALLGSEGVLVGIDADSDAIKKVSAESKGLAPQVHLSVANFRSFESVLDNLHIPQIDRALFDLGWRTEQLSSGRGFSFRADEPLLMTFSSEKQLLTASDIVNEWEPESIIAILEGWGEERAAKRIASAILSARTKGPITTSAQLAGIIESVLPKRGRTHPATRTFQALRMAVNDEMGALAEVLDKLPARMRPDGRVSFVTFHSIEDRIVKRRFLEWKKRGMGLPLTKKPVVPTRDEMNENPAARSAKLRTFVFSKI